MLSVACRTAPIVSLSFDFLSRPFVPNCFFFTFSIKPSLCIMKLCNYTPQLIRGISRIFVFPLLFCYYCQSGRHSLVPRTEFAPFCFLRHCVISGIVSSRVEQKQPVILEVGLECDVLLSLLYILMNSVKESDSRYRRRGR